MSQVRKQPPELNAIRSYWRESGAARGMETRVLDNVEAGEKACFCCGNRRRKLERAHIVPYALGGSSQPDNLLLLCGECHKESPDVASAGVLIQWMNEQRNDDLRMLYDIAEITVRMEGHIKEAAAQLPIEQLQAIAADLTTRAGTHGPRLSRSTLEWLVTHTLNRAAHL